MNPESHFSDPCREICEWSVTNTTHQLLVPREHVFQPNQRRRKSVGVRRRSGENGFGLARWDFCPLSHDLPGQCEQRFPTLAVKDSPAHQSVEYVRLEPVFKKSEPGAADRYGTQPTPLSPRSNPTKRVRLQGSLFLLCMLFPQFAARAATTVTVSPGYTNLGVNSQLQYTATVTGLANTKVKWEIRSVVGGNSTLGTISTTGLYSSPATVPTESILVEAVASDGTIGCQYVNVEPAGPAITAVNPSPLLTGNPTVTLKGTGFQPGDTASLNGNNLSTTYVNSTTLTTGCTNLPQGPEFLKSSIQAAFGVLPSRSRS